MEANDWNASTVALLEKTKGYQADQSASVKEVSKRIEAVTARLAGLDHSEVRLQHLNQVVKAAAGLALDLIKEKTVFKVEKPASTTFDAASMEDVLQDSKGEALHGRSILAVIFPVVSRRGDESGGSYDSNLIIFKAQVLV